MAKRDGQPNTGGMSMQVVDLSQLVAHPDNDYPLDEREMQDLLESIRADGLAQLPLVRRLDGAYQIIAGHRRVECYRRLAGEDPASYGTIPVNVLEDCDDERALVLLDATNLMTRQLTPLERAKRFERLWAAVPALRRSNPGLKGVRTSQVIADIVSRETGQSISRASIDRALAAGRKAQEVSTLVEEFADAIIDEWRQELAAKEGFTPQIVREIASRAGSVQKELWAEYQRGHMSPKQLAKSLEHAAPKTEQDVENALDQVIRILRDVAAWNANDGARIDAYRIDYIKGQLERLACR